MIDKVAQVNQFGFEADETESGHIRMSRIDSDMVYIPFLPSMYGTNSSNLGSATLSAQYQAQGNPFGTMDGLLLNIPSRSSIDGNGALVISFMFSGRKLALHWDRYRNSTSYPITGLIDGRAFTLDNTLRNTQTGWLGTANSGPQYINSVEVPVTLKSDGPHQCQIVFPNFVSGSTRQYMLYGYSVERRFGTYDFNLPYHNATYQAMVNNTLYSLGSMPPLPFPIVGFEILNISGETATVTFTKDGITYPAITVNNNAEYSRTFLAPTKFVRTNGVGSAGSGQATVKATVPSGTIGGSGIHLTLTTRTH